MKIRPAWSFEGAVQVIIAELGEDAAADAVDRSQSLIRKWSDPDHPSLPALDLALALDAAFVNATGREGPISAIYTHQLELDTDVRDVAPANLGMALFEFELAVSETRLMFGQIRKNSTSLNQLSMSLWEKEMLLKTME